MHTFRARYLNHSNSLFVYFINSFFNFSEGWWNTEYCYRASDNMTINDIEIPKHNKTKNNLTTTPVEEFWE
jgi:hypothetical protein